MKSDVCVYFECEKMFLIIDERGLARKVSLTIIGKKRSKMRSRLINNKIVC